MLFNAQFLDKHTAYISYLFIWGKVDGKYCWQVDGKVLKQLCIQLDNEHAWWFSFTFTAVEDAFEKENLKTPLLEDLF